MTDYDTVFAERCLDDLMRAALEAVLSRGRRLRARRGDFTELMGVTLKLEDPRARLSRTEARGRPFSALGEFCWYMSGSDDLASIQYYIPRYQSDAVDGILTGAYGPRLVGEGDAAQLWRVVELLRAYPTSRRAVIRLFDASDLSGGSDDVPCTCTLQYLLRDGRLYAITHMRSNDLYLGLPHDAFCFTLLQEYIACILGVELGAYTHFVGSLHLYEEHQAKALAFLREGFQSTEHPMPPMPRTESTESLRALLDAEEELRANCVDWSRLNRYTANLDPYWADLVRLLQIFRQYRDASSQSSHRSVETVRRIQGQMAADVYYPFIERLIGVIDGV